MSVSSLRQRRRRGGDDKPTASADDEAMEAFVRQFDLAAVRSARGIWDFCRAALFVILAAFATSCIWKWTLRRRGSVGPSATGMRDLKILTVYPRSVSSRVGELSGRTEVLVTDENREVVDAVRTSVAMSNNLHFNGNGRRRKGGIGGALLGISNLVSNLRGGDRQRPGMGGKGFVPGEIVLEPFDEAGMRGYLEVYGGRCSNHRRLNHVDDGDASDSAVNSALLLYDELIVATGDREFLDSSWDRASRLFALCQFANGDARGYVIHGTTVAAANLRLQEMLERARIYGFGIVVRRSRGNTSQSLERVSVPRAPLVIMPSGATSMDLSRHMLHSILPEEASSTVPVFSNSMSFEIDDAWLQKWNAMQKDTAVRTSDFDNLDGFRADAEVDAGWLFLESTVKERSDASDLGWLARYCRGKSCSFVLDSSEN